MADGEPDFEMIEFWGEEVPPGAKRYSVEVENEPPIFHMIHVTGCALGDAPAKGPHVLKAVHNDKPIALATLEKGAAHQFSLDFGISSTTTFINTGASPVYISGYITRSVQHIEGSDEEDEEDEETYSDEVEDDDEAPDAVPLFGAGASRKKRVRALVDEEAEETSDEDEEGGLSEGGSEDDEGEEDEDEEDDEDEEGDEYDRRLGAKSFADGADEDEDEEGLPALDSDDLVAEADSDDEDGAGRMQLGSSDEGDEGESSGEEEEGEDEDEDESDEDAPPREQKNAPPKRQPQPASTPQPAKKQKVAEAKVPASAPPKVQQQKQAAAGKQQQQQQKQKQANGGDAEAEYLSAIVEYVRSQSAPVPLAALGSKVKRPEGVKAKAKAFVTAHADKLAFDEKAQTVSLRKK